MMTFHLTPAMQAELEVFEIDTLDEGAPAAKRIFVAALRAQTPAHARAFDLVLTGEALAYAASPIGAFGNTFDILRDQGRMSLAQRFFAAWTQAQRGAIDESNQADLT